MSEDRGISFTLGNIDARDGKPMNDLYKNNEAYIDGYVSFRELMKTLADAEPPHA